MRRSSRNAMVWMAGVLILVQALYFLIGRRHYYEPSASERSAVGKALLKNGVAVAVVWPRHEDKSFVEGVTMAWEELNASGSPFAGKIRLRFFTEPVRLSRYVFKDRSRDLSRNTDLPQVVASYGDVVAVMGHERTDGVIPASIVYETHGMLFFSPEYTAHALTGHGFQYVFRITPGDDALAVAMAAFAQRSGFKRVGVLYERTNAGDSAAGQLVANAIGLQIAVPFRKSYRVADPWDGQDFRAMIAQLRSEQFDAIMVAGSLPHAAKIIIDLVQMGVTQPILATDKLDSDELFLLAGAAANNVYVVGPGDRDSPAPEFVAFRDRFTRRFGVRPGNEASLGYETFNTFVQACLRSQDADPIAVATTLRTNTWKGLFGEYTFDNQGDIVGTPLFIKRLQNGVFVTVREEGSLEK